MENKIINDLIYKIMTFCGFEYMGSNGWRFRNGKEKIKQPKKLDTSMWTATCGDCGEKGMEYYNFKYHCNKCGNVLEV